MVKRPIITKIVGESIVAPLIRVVWHQAHEPERDRFSEYAIGMYYGDESQEPTISQSTSSQSKADCRGDNELPEL